LKKLIPLAALFLFSFGLTQPTNLAPPACASLSGLDPFALVMTAEGEDDLDTLNRMQVCGYLDVVDEYGQNPLIYAITADPPAPQLEQIIHLQAVNHRTGAGWTPLMYAARENNADAILWLLEAGADPLAYALDGTTALDLAPDNTVLAEATDLALNPPREPMGVSYENDFFDGFRMNVVFAPTSGVFGDNGEVVENLEFFLAMSCEEQSARGMVGILSNQETTFMVGSTAEVSYRFEDGSVNPSSAWRIVGWSYAVMPYASTNGFVRQAGMGDTLLLRIKVDLLRPIIMQYDTSGFTPAMAEQFINCRN